MKIFLITYILLGLVAYYVISGMVFATFEHSFNTEAHRYNASNDEMQRDCYSNLGFSLTWGVGASIVWPVTLPVMYMLTGFAPDGAWTTYPIHHCSTAFP